MPGRAFAWGLGGQKASSYGTLFQGFGFRVAWGLGFGVEGFRLRVSLRQENWIRFQPFCPFPGEASVCTLSITSWIYIVLETGWLGKTRSVDIPHSPQAAGALQNSVLEKFGGKRDQVHLCSIRGITLGVARRRGC